MPFDHPRALRALPTRADLAARCRAYERAANRHGYFFTAVLLAALTGNVVMAPWLERRGVGWMVLALGAAELVTLVLLSNGVMRRLAERHGVACPSCREPLGGAAAQVAVATGNCGRCAAPVARPDALPA